MFEASDNHHWKKLSKDGRAILSGLWIGKRGLLEEGSFQKCSSPRGLREVRDSRDFRERSECRKQRRIRPSSRDYRKVELLEILKIPPVKRPLL